MRIDSRRPWGLRGEGLAYGFLVARGLRVRARNWRTRWGELDLVCVHGDTLVFVEVKARRGGRCGTGHEAVTTSKRRRVMRTAEAYLARHPHRGPCRFDVVVVAWEAAVPRIDYLEGAYP